MGAHNQDTQARQLFQGKSQMGTETFPSQKEGISADGFPLLPPDRDFGWVAKWQPAKVGTSFTLILRQLSFKDSPNGVKRDVVCQLPPEAGHPPDIAARLKKPAQGMNDAPRRWWNILDKALCRQTVYRERHHSVAISFRDSLQRQPPNNWWCEGSQQAGETDQVTASETSVLATHRTVENNWISCCLLPK